MSEFSRIESPVTGLEMHWPREVKIHAGVYEPDDRIVLRFSLCPLALQSLCRLL